MTAHYAGCRPPQPLNSFHLGGRERFANLCFIFSDNSHWPASLNQVKRQISLSLACFTRSHRTPRDLKMSGKLGRYVCPQGRPSRVQGQHGRSFPGSRGRGRPQLSRWILPALPGLGKKPEEGGAPPSRRHFRVVGTGALIPGFGQVLSSEGTRASRACEGLQPREPLFAFSLQEM